MVNIYTKRFGTNSEEASKNELDSGLIIAIEKGRHVYQSLIDMVIYPMDDQRTAISSMIDDIEQIEKALGEYMSYIRYNKTEIGVLERADLIVAREQCSSIIKSLRFFTTDNIELRVESLSLITDRFITYILSTIEEIDSSKSSVCTKGKNDSRGNAGILDIAKTLENASSRSSTLLSIIEDIYINYSPSGDGIPYQTIDIIKNNLEDYRGNMNLIESQIDSIPLNCSRIVVGSYVVKANNIASELYSLLDDRSCNDINRLAEYYCHSERVVAITELIKEMIEM